MIDGNRLIGFPVQRYLHNNLESLEKKLKKQGLRVISDLRNEKIGYKIREHSMQRYPYILVVGDREVENNQISVRQRGGQDLGSMSLEALIELINQE